MSVTDNEDLIVNIERKTRLISKKQIIEAFKEDKFSNDDKATGDKIVDNVIESFRKRSKFGQEKYNTTLENNNLGLKQWCQHIQEELMDAINYLEKVKSIL